jgi:O-antigen/teichoic acid export membrane protein
MLVYQPGGYAEMAMFSAASQWRNAIGFIPGAMAQFALPLLSDLGGDKDTSRYGKALRWNLILAALAATAVAAPVALGAPYIMRLYGAGFQQGSLILVLSAATAVIACINAVVGTAILSTGSVWIGFGFNALWAGVLLSCCHFFVHTNLAVGLAGSMLVAYVAHSAWQLLYLRRLLSSSPMNQSPVCRTIGHTTKRTFRIAAATGRQGRAPGAQYHVHLPPLSGSQGMRGGQHLREP